MTAFADPLSLTSFDPDHPDEEDRYLLLGVSSASRLLVIAHSDRGEAIRIISARLATRRERRSYADL